MPREAWILFIGAFVNRLGTFVLPFITLYLTDRGYTVPQAGLGLAGYGLGAIGAQGVGGLLADRLGRRNTIAVSMFGGSLLTLSLVWVSGLWAIIGVVILLGFVAELYRPASSALIVDLIPSERRVAAFSTYRLMLNLGFAVGLALGGVLASRSYDLLFIGDAITAASFGAIASRPCRTAPGPRSTTSGISRARAGSWLATPDSCCSSARCSSPHRCTCRTPPRSRST